MVNAELLRAGLAQLLTIPPNVKYVELFTRLQREAREAGSGLWGEKPAAGTGVRIERVDLVAEEVVIVNDGSWAVDLSGWVISAPRAGTVLAPGGRLIIGRVPRLRRGSV